MAQHHPPPLAYLQVFQVLCDFCLHEEKIIKNMRKVKNSQNIKQKTRL